MKPAESGMQCSLTREMRRGVHGTTINYWLLKLPSRQRSEEAVVRVLL
jgi:hypothetical protein